ncbi:MAG: ABC transporter permease subunit [Verrucomicrobiia bacterium]
MTRVWLLAKVTLWEALRHRVLNVLLLFALAIIGTANFFSQLSFDEQLKFVKDFSFGAMTLIGVLMAVVSMAQLLPQEVENRTLFTILSKPVRRWEFLAGKCLGMALTLLLALVMMALVFGVVLKLQEKNLEQQILQQMQETVSLEEKAEAHETLQKIQAEVRDPYLFMAFGIIYGRWLLVAAVALLISTFSTSMLFTVVMTMMVYVIGHLQSTAREMWWHVSAGVSTITKGILVVVSLCFPDFQMLSGVDNIVVGAAPSGLDLFYILGYVVLYVGVAVGAACLIFSQREW